jgi:hypothetical protein
LKYLSDLSSAQGTIGMTLVLHASSVLQTWRASQNRAAVDRHATSKDPQRPKAPDIITAPMLQTSLVILIPRKSMKIRVEEQVETTNHINIYQPFMFSYFFSHLSPSNVCFKPWPKLNPQLLSSSSSMKRSSAASW